MRRVVVTGTGTEIGKTWVAVEVLGALRRSGWSVATRKPSQSFAVGEGATDAERLAAATGEDAADVCPPHRSYRVPMAPPMAAEALGLRPARIDELVKETNESLGSVDVDIALIEAAGGVAAPQADDGDTCALIQGLKPDLVVLVGPAGLGTINLVRLSMAALAPWPTIVYLNRYDTHGDLHVRNRAWLVERDGFEVTTDIVSLVSWVVPRLGPHD
jgi:dethiobiotin synthetase